MLPSAATSNASRTVPSSPKRWLSGGYSLAKSLLDPTSVAFVSTCETSPLVGAPEATCVVVSLVDSTGAEATFSGAGATTRSAGLSAVFLGFTAKGCCLGWATCGLGWGLGGAGSALFSGAITGAEIIEAITTTSGPCIVVRGVGDVWIDRVQAGPFASRDAAQSAARTLRERLGLESLLISR